MQTGQLHSPEPLIFRRLAAAIVACLLLTSCADSTEEALQKGAQAQQLFDQKQLPAAREAIAEAVAERDDIVDLHILRARIEFAAGSPSTAYDAYYDAMSLDTSNMEALMGVAQLGLRTGHLRDSFDATEKILSLDPAQGDARLLYGVQLVFRRRYDEAIAEANKILTAQPDSENAAILKTRALFLSGREAEAMATINSDSLASRKNEPLALTRLELYRETGDTPKMLEQFAVLKAVGATTPALLIDEANTRFKLGDAALATQLLVRASSDLRLSQADARSITGLWREFGNGGPNEAQLQKITANGSPVVREEFARYFIEIGNARNAQRFVSGLRTANAKGLQARIYLLQARVQDARTLANDILDSDNTQCDALIVRSSLSLRAGKSDGALQDAQRAAAECSGNIDAWLALASAYDARSQKAGAQRAFLQGITANPQDVRLTKAYVRWLETQGKSTAAVAAGRRLTRAVPALNSAWLLYGDLCRRLDPSCVGDAQSGLEAARSRYAIDLPLDTMPPVGMFGRLNRR